MPVRFSAIFLTRRRCPQDAWNEVSDAVFVRIWAARCNFFSSSLSCCAALCLRAPSKARRWSAAPRSPIPWRCANSIREHGLRLGRAGSMCAGSDRPTLPSPTISCSPCRRWRRSAGRSMASSIVISAAHKAGLPDETIGVGTSYDFQLFDRALLYSADARFVLAGIVNRMDRAYVSPESCGEDPADLPADAHGDRAAGRGRALAAAADDAERGAEGEGRRHDRRQAASRSPARRSPGAGSLPANCRSPAPSLRPGCSRGTARSNLIEPENIDRIETNLQIAHAPKSAVRDFRTDYLLKVFRFDPKARAVRGSADGKPDRSRADSGGRRISGATSRPGCSIPGISMNSIAARS